MTVDKGRILRRFGWQSCEFSFESESLRELSGFR